MGQRGKEVSVYISIAMGNSQFATTIIHNKWNEQGAWRGEMAREAQSSVACRTSGKEKLLHC